LPRQVPSSSTDPSLPTSRNSAATDKRVLLYRDTNAWCPFCERVWLALLEKDIPFDTVFIDLRNKPQWYLDMVPSKLVPAVRIDGELVVESRDILLAIEAAFPESTPLLPPARTSERARVEALMDLADDSEKGVGSAGYRFLTGGGMFGGVRDESDVRRHHTSARGDPSRAEIRNIENSKLQTQNSKPQTLNPKRYLKP